MKHYKIKKIFATSIFVLTIILTTQIASAGLENPMRANSVPELIGLIIKAVLGVVGSIALLMFIYGGFTWLTSGGSEKKIKEGRETLIWSIMGLVVIFASYAILRFVFEILAL